jgi:hypothetical protein
MSQITSLTANTSLALADLLVVVDVDDTTMAATGTDKKLAISDLQTLIKAGPVSAVAQPGNPAGTTSATLVMMGLGSSCKLTPGSSGKVLVNFTGQIAIAAAVQIITFGPRYGTGSAPANAAAVSGTRFGTAADWTFTPPAITIKYPFAFTDLLTLTPATAYWMDIAVGVAAADSVTLTNISFTALEIS